MGSNPISCKQQVISSPDQKKDSAKMSERLRSATQVRMAQASWVRIPLFAKPVSPHRLQVGPLQFWVSAYQKIPFNSVSSVVERSALNRTVEGSTPSQSVFRLRY